MFIGSYYWKPTAVKQLLLAALAIFPIICLFYKKRNIQSYAYRELETFGRYSLEIYVFIISHSELQYDYYGRLYKNIR